VKIAALVVVAGIAYLFASGNVDLSFSMGSVPDSTVPLSSDRSRVVQDVRLVLDATSSPDSVRDGKAARKLLDRAGARTTARGDALIERRLRVLIWRIQNDLVDLRHAVATADVSTSVGAKCRRATLAVLARQRQMWLGFAADVRRHPARAAVGRLRAQSDRLDRWFGKQLQSCIAGASREDRAAIETALGW
jgi:hypothetical protein